MVSVLATGHIRTRILEIGSRKQQFHMVVDPMQLQQRQLMDTILQQRTQQQVQQQMQQQRGQQAHQAQHGAPQNGGNETSQQLNLRGFDNIETFSGSEEEWQNWWWEAASGLNGELVEVLSAAETRGIENKEEILGEEQLVDASPATSVPGAPALKL